MDGAGRTAGTRTRDPRDEDAELARRARDGDARSYDELYRRHREVVARTAYLVIRDEEAAQEVAQEAFLIGWRDLRRLREPRAFRAWVTGIALNLCRRGSLRPRLAERTDTAEGEAVEDRDPMELKLLVRQAVASLPHRLRSVVVMRFYGAYTNPEIAEALGVPIGTVKSRLHRARARLLGALEPLREER